MLTFTLIVAIVAVLVAVLGLLRARSARQRAEHLAESYWELRYEIGQLKVRLNRVETETGLREADPDPEAEAASPRASTTTFVPLSSLKK